MFRAAQFLFKVAPIAMVLAGCAVFRENSGPTETFAPRTQTYFLSYDVVWRATQIALQNYPMRVNNIDAGIIETEPIKPFADGGRSPLFWVAPYKANEPVGAGKSYFLRVHVTKGTAGPNPAVRVNITKKLTNARDFFSDPTPLPSDGLEEQSILYRIARELQIEMALERVQKKSSSSP